MRLHRNALHGLAGLSLFGMAATYTAAPQPLILGPTPIDTLPFVISSPGSYCLVGNLSGNDGIVVEVDDVDIDLAGFTLEGPGAGGEHGIVYTASARNVRVHDGTISNWGGYAIGLYMNSVIENVTARNCESGFLVNAESIVDQCTAFDIEETCLHAGPRSLITNCNLTSTALYEHVLIAGDASTILDTRATGGATCFWGHSQVHVERCFARSFRSSGFHFEDRAVLVDCQADQEGTDSQGEADGIRAGAHSRIERCRIDNVESQGIFAGSYCQVLDCSVSRTGKEGIRVLKDSQVSGCIIFEGNLTGSAQAGGIKSTSGASIERTTISSSQGPGILIGGDSARVTDNIVRYNTGPGLVLYEGGLAEGNTIQHNSEEGILALQPSNVIRDNVVDENAVGVRLQTHSNLLTGNRVWSNTDEDFDMVWGNAHGPIRPADAHIMGSDPQANYGRD